MHVMAYSSISLPMLCNCISVHDTIRICAFMPDQAAICLQEAFLCIPDFTPDTCESSYCLWHSSPAAYVEYGPDWLVMSIAV